MIHRTEDLFVHAYKVSAKTMRSYQDVVSSYVEALDRGNWRPRTPPIEIEDTPSPDNSVADFKTAENGKDVVMSELAESVYSPVFPVKPPGPVDSGAKTFLDGRAYKDNVCPSVDRPLESEFVLTKDQCAKAAGANVDLRYTKAKHIGTQAPQQEYFLQFYKDEATHIRTAELQDGVPELKVLQVQPSVKQHSPGGSQGAGVPILEYGESNMTELNLETAKSIQNTDTFAKWVRETLKVINHCYLLKWRVYLLTWPQLMPSDGKSNFLPGYLGGK
ncbi:hypothetical protein R3P38DRAFT_2764010 [Favolaschia claudopus]|uniref:Uncharacterized protein n=1 Tax=Favolaschia claudopus TaxID=2862362 RepID=A0AAW0DDZ2_9AGAR